MDDDIGRGPLGSLDSRGKASGGLLGASQAPLPLDSAKAKPKPVKPAPVLNKPRVTTDISEPDRKKVIRFCEYQKKNNPAGIGNECLHFILAAEFEIRCLETDASLVWGRTLTPATSAEAGDIAQYKDHIGSFFVFTKKFGGYTYDKKRLPDHTGVLTRPPANGVIQNWEAHLHDHLDPALPVMQLRVGTAYYEDFCIKVPLTIADPAAQAVAKRLDAAISDYSTDKSHLMAIPFADARSTFTIPASEGAVIEQAVRSGNAPDDIAVYFRSRVTGSVTFYRMQQDAARAGETDPDAATDKARLVSLMRQTGRAGVAGGDAFGGDDKQARTRPTDYFTWTFTDTPPTTP